MERLTRPDVEALMTAVRFMDNEVKIQDIHDKLLHLILNGPTINSVKKDTLRHLVRQLYAELKRYEDLEMTPEAIEHQLKNYSSFLMEMTGGRMSKTGYTVLDMVSEANNHFESLCDECSDRQKLAAYEKTGLTPEQVEALKQELIDERYRHDRLQDFEVAEGQELARVKADRDAAVRDLQEYGGCPSCKHKDVSSMEEPCVSCFRSNGREDKWEWRGAKDTNVPSKSATDINVGSKED